MTAAATAARSFHKALFGLDQAAHERRDFLRLGGGELGFQELDVPFRVLFHTRSMRRQVKFMLMDLQNIRFGYGGTVILDGVSFTLSERERVGLVGANGEGKTTLIKLMTGALSPDAGTIRKKGGLRIGILEQNGGLDADGTVYAAMQAVFAPVIAAMERMHEVGARMAEAAGSDELRALADKYEKLERAVAAADGYNIDVKIRTVLGGMGFADRYEQSVRTMSGGEKTRLKLCRLLLEEPELLFLDEPTNHLDIGTLFWLEEYLKSYKGALFVVSHDRYFLDAVTEKTLELERRKVTAFRGNYTKYKALKAEKYAHDLKEYEKQQQQNVPKPRVNQIDINNKKQENEQQQSKPNTQRSNASKNESAPKQQGKVVSNKVPLTEKQKQIVAQTVVDDDIGQFDHQPAVRTHAA